MSVLTSQSVKDSRLYQSRSTGDFLPYDLSSVINRPEVSKLIAKAWAEKASSCRSTIAFAVNVAHAKSLAECFRELDPPVDARVVHGKTPPPERSALLHDFRTGVVSL